MSDAMNNRHIKDVDSEIEEMEKAIYGVKNEDPSTEDSEEELEEIEVDEAEETEEELQVEEIEVESAEVEVEEEPKKPKRFSWKTKYEEDSKIWSKHRATLEGNVYQLKQQNASLLKQVDVLSEQMDVLSGKIATISSETSTDVKSLFSEEDRDILGDTAIDSVAKVAEKLVEQQMKPIREREAARAEEEKRRRKEAAEMHKREAANLFVQRLASLVPDYEKIDTDPHFLEYLDDTDPASGFKRFQLFKQAQQIGDVGRVAHFFNEFVNISRGPEDSLERRVAPSSRSEVSTSRSKNNPGLIPYSEIESFHRAVATKTFYGTREEMEALDKKYDRAFNENRIDYKH